MQKVFEIQYFDGLSLLIFFYLPALVWIQCFSFNKKQQQDIPLSACTTGQFNHKHVHFILTLQCDSLKKQVAQRATIAHLSPMCQCQTSFKKKWIRSIATQEKGRHQFVGQ